MESKVETTELKINQENINFIEEKNDEENESKNNIKTNKKENDLDEDPYSYLNRDTFSSEFFKLEVKNLPKSFGFGVICFLFIYS